MKKYYVAILIIFINFSLNAQDITSIFLSIPETIMPGLDAESRDKLIANADDTTRVETENALNEQIVRMGISEDYLMYQTSAIGTIQIKLLPLINNSKIICLIKTVCGKACDSNVQFFTTDWVELNSNNLFPEKNKEWFIKKDIDRSSDAFLNAYAALDMNPIKVLVSSNSSSLEIQYDIKEYLSVDDYSKIQPYLTNKPHVLTWDKISYK